MRRLGVKIPKTYKRIFSARCLPKLIQEELVKYPETVIDDSDYESDSACRQKYTDDPLKYIINSDEKKRTAIEQNAEPRRIHQARTKRGDLNFDIVKKLQNDAVHLSLESQGLHREMTKERRNGEVKAPDRQVAQQKFEVELARQIQSLLESGKSLQSSDCQRLLEMIKDKTNLKEFPQVIQTLY